MEDGEIDYNAEQQAHAEAEGEAQAEGEAEVNITIGTEVLYNALMGAWVQGWYSKDQTNDNNKRKDSQKILDKLSGKVNIMTNKTCPQCGSEFVKKSGKYGDFWGCKNFPKCKYSESLNGKDALGKYLNHSKRSKNGRKD